jgi:hypothetical protein
LTKVDPNYYLDFAKKKNESKEKKNKANTITSKEIDFDEEEM